MAYAKGTEVSVEKSQGEIRSILSRYNATGFAFGEQARMAVVMFEISGRRIRFNLPFPDIQEDRFQKRTPRSYFHDMTKEAARKRHDQAIRERWRSLTLTIKAKLEAVEIGITTLEEEFLAHIVLPNGRTMGEVAIPQIERSYSDGTMPPLLGFQ